MYTDISYFWEGSKRYHAASFDAKKMFGERIQKISTDAGFSCPNRDGTKATGGCTYCNNKTFNPFYCSPKKSITEQLTEGIAFFSKKYKTQKYIAYFQAYTNTYAELSVLKAYWEEALKMPDIIGLAISTRPDCIDSEKLDYLQKLAETHYISIEYGIESTKNETLKFINRAHSFEESCAALQMSAGRGIHIGVHLILGLPGESHDDMLNHAKIISELPFDTLKLHQLQIIKQTKMAKQYFENPNQFHLLGLDEYICLIADFLELLNPKIKIERFVSESPKNMIIAPDWGGKKNFEIVAKIEKYLAVHNMFQGKKYRTED
jgi:radical SAM protein (TIGR01212 family)